MIAKSITASGGSVFWNVAQWSDQKRLKDALDFVGLGEFAPKTRGLGVALKDALEDVCGRKDHLIRPLDDALGFVVVKEERGKTQNSYQTSLMAKIDPDQMQIKFSPYDDRAARIVASFNRHLGYVSASQVGTALANLVRHLRGVVLRQNGGLYWLPESAIEKWQQTAAAIESASAIGSSSVTLMRMVVDPSALRAVRTAINEEVQAEAQRLFDEVASGTLGEKALEHRVKLLQEMEGKITEYESILGESLTTLRESIDKVQTASGMGAFLASVAQDASQQPQPA